MTRLVLYDGDCGICQGLVRFLVQRDRGGRLRFAPLQGATAKQLFGRCPGTRSLIYVEAGRVFRGSEAVLRAVAQLGGGWKGVGGLRYLPRFLRDGVYRGFARIRRRLPVRTACPLLRPEQAARFLP